LALLISNVSVPSTEEEAARLLSRLLGIKPPQLQSVRLIRKSLDARPHPPVWRGNYQVELDPALEQRILARRVPNVRAWTERDGGRFGVEDTTPARAPWSAGRVIVVGAGPAGMFAALFLAESGVPVLLLDRGGAVDARVGAVNGFWRRKLPLDTENNLLFGEGGAGTFSDGKIYTRRRDAEIGYVLRRFVDCGAKPEILEEGWAHLGTDKVREILPVFRERLRAHGAEVRFDARVVGLVVEGGRCVGVRLADGAEERGAAVLVAPGHSARDTVQMLVEAGAPAVARPVAIGARVEHPQTLIDRARYGVDARGDLPASSYRLAWHPPTGAKARTFCMCPGGMVVPAMHQPGQVVVNGMSFAAQRGLWANSAVIVEVDVSAYGGAGPLAGYRWQAEIERRAFELGGGDFTAPAQRVEDLLAGVGSAELPRTSYPLGVKATDLREVLPAVVTDAMVLALRQFDREVPGFVGPEAVLIAPETRTTSPLAFLRDAACQSAGLPGLWPVGEGAGFGGGIVSCAIDGLRAARGLMDVAPGVRAAS
jgi:uncharacterized FAD-dependent dehydrogenase